MAALEARLDEALDYAVLNGLVKYGADGALAHAPLALAPSPIPAALHDSALALTAPFNRLAHALARDGDFLRETLSPAARVDPFLARLLQLAEAGRGTQPLYLGITRSDYFVHQPVPEAQPVLRQVELNTISASYPGLSDRVARLHRYLLRETPLAAHLAPNEPLPVLADAFEQAFRRYGHPDARVLMVVQAGEANVFDQRHLEFALRERGLVTRRLTLDEVGRDGRLRDGHLAVDGEVMAITYFRAAYGPEDFPDEAAFQARALIEASSTIAVPHLHTQLAGAKKVQQSLTDPAVLGRLLAPRDADAVAACFAGQYDLEQPVPADGGRLAAWEAAVRAPADYVLKPQREGGGHNLFDDALVARLRELPASERAAYILMERIRPARHPAVLVRERRATHVDAVSEIGRFGAYLAEGTQELLNRDAGYLVRTKAHDTQEGGVSAGFGFLDSLLVLPRAPA